MVHGLSQCIIAVWSLSLCSLSPTVLSTGPLIVADYPGNKWEIPLLNNMESGLGNLKVGFPTCLNICRHREDLSSGVSVHHISCSRLRYRGS